MATDWGNSSVPMPFWDVIRCMSAQNALYDVMMMPDGVLREDDFDPQSLDGYRMLVVPDCVVLTKNQEEAILRFARTGAPVLIYGRLAEGILFLKDSYGTEEDGSTLCICPSREDMANLSNMTTSNAIRTLSVFVQERLISLDGRKIKILNEPALQKISRMG